MNTSVSNQLNQFVVRINALPEEQRKKHFGEIRKAISLGMRALILKNLRNENKEELERITMNNKDEELFMFAQTHIPHFQNKFKQLMEEISETLVQQES